MYEVKSTSDLIGTRCDSWCQRYDEKDYGNINADICMWTIISYDWMLCAVNKNENITFLFIRCYSGFFFLSFVL